MPQKYNTPIRLWQNAFHLLLERLRLALDGPSPPKGLVAHETMLDHLVDFIQYAYVFYTTLLEEPSMSVFRSIWLEQLGDLARYRVAVAGLVDRLTSATVEPGHELVEGRVEHLPADDTSRPKTKNESADVASIGEAALGDWDVDEAEIWRKTAIDWYGKGLAETPGAGRLHYNLAALSDGDALRYLYHCCRRCVHARERRLSLNF